MINTLSSIFSTLEQSFAICGVEGEFCFGKNEIEEEGASSNWGIFSIYHY